MQVAQRYMLQEEKGDTASQWHIFILGHTWMPIRIADWITHQRDVLSKQCDINRSRLMDKTCHTATAHSDDTDNEPLPRGWLREPSARSKFVVEQLPRFETITGLTEYIVISLTSAATSIKQRYCPYNSIVQVVIDAKVEKMELEGIIECSHSTWSSSVVMMRKKDGNNCFCINFRKINNVCLPLPQVITAILDKLRGMEYHRQILLSSLDSSSPRKILLQFTIISFWLYSAPTNLITARYGTEIRVWTIHFYLFVNDIIINQTSDEHLRGKVCAITGLHLIKQIRQFLSVVSWNRQFI